MTYTLTTLPNGLRVASDSLAGVESVSVCVSVDVGARYERKEDGGLSHVLEHMAFKGTKRRSAKDLAEAFDNIGGQFNAFTSLEHTVYYAKVLKNDVELAVDVLADIMQNSTFDDGELARERDVILQEIAMYNDSPDDLVFDYFNETAYPNQPLGRTILGTPERIGSVSRDDLVRYMGGHYFPSRMVLSAAGNITHEELLTLVDRHFALPASTASLDAEPGRYAHGESRKESDFEQMHLVMGWEGVSIHDKDYYAAQLLSTILGGGMSSRLFQEVREKRGLAYSVSAFSSSFVDTGIFGLYTATGEDKATEMMPVACEEVNKMTRGVTPEELRRAKNQLIAGMMMSRESTSSVAESIGRHLFYFGEYRSVADITARVEAVTREDIARVASRIISGSKPAIAALGPISRLESYDATLARFRA